jgi:fluoride ion exporter CrcB/FEX
MLDYISVMLGGALGTGARFWVRAGLWLNAPESFFLWAHSS